MEQTSAIIKALADKTRLNILLLLSKQEMAVCEIISKLDLSQPAVSHHLKLLKHAGLVKDMREGKWIYYTIDLDSFKSQSESLKTILDAVVENTEEGIMPSAIRSQPCLCKKLQAKE